MRRTLRVFDRNVDSIFFHLWGKISLYDIYLLRTVYLGSRNNVIGTLDLHLELILE